MRDKNPTYHYFLPCPALHFLSITSISITMHLQNSCHFAENLSVSRILLLEHAEPQKKHLHKYLHNSGNVRKG